MATVLEASPTLLALTNLFAQLNEQGIRYCHWKSTHGLPKALTGRTDLDLLVDRRQSRQFKEILCRLDFKPFVSHPQRQFPAIEDYLGFDAATGRLIHLHIHYQLVLGEQYAKNYYLPLEQAFLDHVELRLGVKVPTPELELSVLVLRALLKYRDRDLLRDLFSIGGRSGIPPGILNECRSLLSQTTEACLMRVVEQQVKLVPPDLVRTFLVTVERAPRSAWTLWRLRRRVRYALVPYQRYSRMRARAVYYRIMLSREWPFNRVKHVVLSARDKRKIPVAGGLTIAFVGADGAGKSTIIDHLRKWLAWRLAVRTYYMGNSQPSFPSDVIKRVAKAVQRAHSGCTRLFGPNAALTRWLEHSASTLRSLRYLADAGDRMRRYRAGRRKAAQGAIIIYDRYPLDAVEVFNHAVDGARITSSSNGHTGRLTRRLAAIEQRMYQRILPVDHLFVLHVSPDVARTRKPEHDPRLLEAKSRALQQLAGEHSHVTHIDADRPLEEVLLQIKATLWRLL